MSDCCGNPGVGDPPKGLELLDYKFYRPGEVRLYGRPGPSYQIYTMSDEEIERSLEEELAKLEFIGGNAKAAATAAKNILARNIAGGLVGIFEEAITFTMFDGTKIHSLPVNVDVLSKKICHDMGYIQSIGVIYGYAYEGHCYKLPKPQIMFLPEPARNIVGDKCGCDCGYTPELGYAVWQIDKLERVIALDVRSDDLKTLVLDENLPGNRSPLAYAQAMSLSPQRHRD